MKVQNRLAEKWSPPALTPLTRSNIALFKDSDGSSCQRCSLRRPTGEKFDGRYRKLSRQSLSFYVWGRSYSNPPRSPRLMIILDVQNYMKARVILRSITTRVRLPACGGNPDKSPALPRRVRVPGFRCARLAQERRKRTSELFRGRGREDKCEATTARTWRPGEIAIFACLAGPLWREATEARH
ncbi:hypothetical protein Bbelb_105040 [Branchiostoma belcheri]|nr:hypothetical protein Bbelb_105040 [Branchiostoma belcheri]